MLKGGWRGKLMGLLESRPWFPVTSVPVTNTFQSSKSQNEIFHLNFYKSPLPEYIIAKTPDLTEFRVTLTRRCNL